MKVSNSKFKSSLAIETVYKIPDCFDCCLSVFMFTFPDFIFDNQILECWLFLCSKKLRMFISASRPWKWMVYQYWENPFLSISALSLASCIIRLSLDIQLYFPQTFFSLDPIHSIQYLFPREIMDLLSI